MMMPGRQFSDSSLYRYGFNGKENDNEVKGEGNQQDYGMRVYDPRLGKFLSVDPLSKGYPFYSTYQFASNCPILALDIDGMESSTTTNNTETLSSSKLYSTPGNGLVRAAAGTTVERYKNEPYTIVKTNKKVNVSSDMIRSVTSSSGVRYSARWNRNTGNFLGYKDDLNNPVPNDVLTVQPVFNQGKAPSQSVFTTAFSVMRLTDPINYNLINDPIIGLKTLGSSLFGYDKSEVKGLGGESTTFDQRFMGGVSFFSYTSTLGLSSLETRAAQLPRAFYSGPGTEALALENKFTTLSQTRAARNLLNLTKGMPYEVGSESWQMWGRLSRAYAKGASGNVHVFQNAATGVDMGSIWRNFEYPALKANPNVKSIIFDF